MCSCACALQHLEEPSRTTMNIQKKMNRGENNASSIKRQKNNIFQSTINLLTSFGESFLRMSVLSLLRRNNSLSVTIVNDEDSINTEIIKCLLDKEKLLNINTEYAFNLQREKPSTTTGKEYDALLGYNVNEDIAKMNDENVNVIHNLRSSINSNICKNSSTTTFQSRPHVHIRGMSGDITDKIETDLQICIYSNKDILNDTKNFTHNYVYNKEDTPVDAEYFHIVHDLDIPLQLLKSVEKISMSVPAFDMCQKIWSNITNRFSSKMESICYKEPVKYPSTKQQKRDNTVTMYIGSRKSWSHRPRALQFKNQKERIKRDLATDIQDDYEIWQEIEVNHIVQNSSLLDNSSLDDKEYEFLDITKLTNQVDNPKVSKFSHNISKEQKLKTNKVMKQEKLEYSTRMHYMPKPSTGKNYYYEGCNNKTVGDLQNNQFRSRLISESSSEESEDSYCISFESGSEIDCTFNIDFEETRTEDSEDDENVEEIMKHKVKFDVNPIVHTMIHWDYAYRAARKGPWEQIARDRDRFKRHIQNMAIILNPILATDHRFRIWQERYAVHE